MMATATMSRSREKTGTWSNIFPTEQVSEQQSALFVKKLLAVAVSNITYLRAIFPEHAFGDRSLEDLHLKILRDDSTCPGACQVIKWVKGCFDALDKKYLKMLVIGAASKFAEQRWNTAGTVWKIFADAKKPDTVIESYTFKFSYAENGGIAIYRNNKCISSAYSAPETKKATIRLLRTIVVLTQSLHSLPDEVMMTMKLLYYDESTPTEYEPPGFAAAECDNFTFEEEPMNIKIGDVSTPFHTVKLRIKTDANQFEMSDEPKTTCKQNQPGQEISDAGLDQDTDMTMDQSDAVELDIIEDDEDAREGQPEMAEPAEADSAPNLTPAKPGVGGQAVGRTGSQSSSSQIPPEDLGVRCPCGNNEDDGMMILCAACNKWQHGVCFAILQEDQAPLNHVCNTCGNVDNQDLLPTDPSLHNLDEVELQARCLWRRALLACTETSRLQQTNLAQRFDVEMTVAGGLVNRLEKEGYLKPANKTKRLGKVVVKDKLMSEGMVKYFQRQTREDQSINKTSGTPTDIAMKDDDVGQNVKKGEEESTSHDNEVQISGSTIKQIESLTDKAGKIDISGKHRKKKNSGSVQQEPANEEKLKRGRKRVKSREDSEQEFEVCNSQESQDICYSEGEMRPKRRKASIAKRSILV